MNKPTEIVRDLLIALILAGLLWHFLELKPVLGLVIGVTVFFSLRSINKKFPDKKTGPADKGQARSKKGKKRK